MCRVKWPIKTFFFILKRFGKDKLGEVFFLFGQVGFRFGKFLGLGLGEVLFWKFKLADRTEQVSLGYTRLS